MTDGLDEILDFLDNVETLPPLDRLTEQERAVHINGAAALLSETISDIMGNDDLKHPEILDKFFNIASRSCHQAIRATAEKALTVLGSDPRFLQPQNIPH